MTIDQARRRQAFARWHRRIALVLFAWLAVLAVTGLVINHAHDLGLDRRPLPPWLLDKAYGMAAGEGQSCPAAVRPRSACAGIFARLELPGGALILSPNTLYFLDSGGQLIESLGAAQVGLSRVDAGFRDAGWVYLKGEGTVVSSDFELLVWRPLDAAAIRDLPTGRWQWATEPADTLTWERLFLDVHAGRFLGPLANYFTDLVAVLTLALVLSGGWLWWLKRSAGRRSEQE